MTSKFIPSFLLAAALCSCSNISSVLSNQKAVDSDDSSPLATREIKAKNICEIESARGVAVVYKQGASTSVTVSAPSDIVDYLEVEIDGSSLSCSVDKDYKIHNGMDRVVVNVVSPTIKNLEASTAGSIKVEGSLDLDNNDLSVSGTTSGCVMIDAVKCGYVKCDVSTAGSALISGIICSGTVEVESSTGATADLEGLAAKVDFSASTGSSINAHRLVAEKGDAGASTGANISCCVKYLNNSSSTGGSIKNKQ